MSFPPDTFKSMVAFYPVTKAYADNSSSWKEFGDGFGLDSGLMEAFNEAFLHIRHTQSSGVAGRGFRRCAENTAAHIDGGCGPRYSERPGCRFCRPPAAASNKVEYRLVPGSVHLFITVRGRRRRSAMPCRRLPLSSTLAMSERILLVVAFEVYEGVPYRAQWHAYAVLNHIFGGYFLVEQE